MVLTTLLLAKGGRQEFAAKIRIPTRSKASMAMCNAEILTMKQHSAIFWVNLLQLPFFVTSIFEHMLELMLL